MINTQLNQLTSVQSTLLGPRAGLRCWLTNSDQNEECCPSRNSSLRFLSKVCKRRCKARRFTNHKKNDDPIDDDVWCAEFRRCTSDCTEWRGCRFHRPENTLFWQVCNQQSQGSPESSKSLTSQFSEQKKRPPFRARAGAHMRMCRRHHFRFPEFSLKFADISGYLRPNTLVMYAVFPRHRITAICYVIPSRWRV